MTDTRDPRGIVNFFIRYLVLHAVFLLGFTLSYVTDLFLFYFFGFIGFFTFFQMLIAIPPKVPRRGRIVEASRDRGRPPLGRGGPVVAGRESLRFFGGLQLGARGHMVAFPLPRCLLRVGTPRDLPFAGSSTNYYA